MLANIVSKYIVCFVLWESPLRTLSYQDYVAKNREISTELASRSTIESTIKWVRYQLEMALDIPATIEIMAEIIHESAKRASFGWIFTGLALWSGSGILMVAQYIWAKIAWVSTPNIIGIELDYSAQLLSDRLIWRLWIWQVVRWDSRNWELYPKDNPEFISNENLSTRGIPFRYIKRDEQDTFEPFIENISALSDFYGANIFQSAGFFPRGLSSWNIFDSVEWRKFLATQEYGIKYMRLLSTWSDPATCNYPICIPIWDRWKKLDDIGNSWMPMFIWERWKRRWANTSDIAIARIHELQRAHVKMSKTSKDS
jgi:hypothetical protein